MDYKTLYKNFKDNPTDETLKAFEDAFNKSGAMATPEGRQWYQDNKKAIDDYKDKENVGHKAGDKKVEGSRIQKAVQLFDTNYDEDGIRNAIELTCKDNHNGDLSAEDKKALNDFKKKHLEAFKRVSGTLSDAAKYVVDSGVTDAVTNDAKAEAKEGDFSQEAVNKAAKAIEENAKMETAKDAARAIDNGLATNDQVDRRQAEIRQETGETPTATELLQTDKQTQNELAPFNSEDKKEALADLTGELTEKQQADKERQDRLNSTFNPTSVSDTTPQVTPQVTPQTTPSTNTSKNVNGTTPTENVGETTTSENTPTTDTETDNKGKFTSSDFWNKWQKYGSAAYPTLKAVADMISKNAQMKANTANILTGKGSDSSVYAPITTEVDKMQDLQREDKASIGMSEEEAWRNAESGDFTGLSRLIASGKYKYEDVVKGLSGATRKEFEDWYNNAKTKDTAEAQNAKISVFQSRETLNQSYTDAIRGLEQEKTSLQNAIRALSSNDYESYKSAVDAYASAYKGVNTIGNAWTTGNSSSNSFGMNVTGGVKAIQATAGTNPTSGYQEGNTDTSSEDIGWESVLKKVDSDAFANMAKQNKANDEYIQKLQNQIGIIQNSINELKAEQNKAMKGTALDYGTGE